MDRSSTTAERFRGGSQEARREHAGRRDGERDGGPEPGAPWRRGPAARRPPSRATPRNASQTAATAATFGDAPARASITPAPINTSRNSSAPPISAALLLPQASPADHACFMRFREARERPDQHEHRSGGHAPASMTMGPMTGPNAIAPNTADSTRLALPATSRRLMLARVRERSALRLGMAA